jgi:hypothetical protein
MGSGKAIAALQQRILDAEDSRWRARLSHGDAYVWESGHLKGLQEALAIVVHESDDVIDLTEHERNVIGRRSD